jgi:hypothetical protein
LLDFFVPFFSSQLVAATRISGVVTPDHRNKFVDGSHVDPLARQKERLVRSTAAHAIALCNAVAKHSAVWKTIRLPARCGQFFLTFLIFFIAQNELGERRP